MAQAKRVTDAELAVLRVLWEAGEAHTIRSLADKLYPDGSNSDYATVQKLLERLEAKSCVQRDRSAFAHSFTSLVSQEDLISQQLEDIASKMFEGSTTPLLMHLVKGSQLSAAERSELEDLLANQKEIDLATGAGSLKEGGKA